MGTVLGPGSLLQRPLPHASQDLLMRALTRNDVREIDRRAIEEFGLPGIVLMENAGRGAAELLHAIAPRATVAIVCGRGNNGGDGFVIARHLENHGHAVRLLLACDPAECRGDAAIAWRVADKAGLPATLMVDCSHANSSKQHQKQLDVARDIAAQMAGGSRQVFGVMVESHLTEGAQKFSPGKDSVSALAYGQSITDACLGWEDSKRTLQLLSEAVAARRARP